MRRITILLIMLFTAFSLKADASMVIMDYQGSTVVHPNGLERNLLLNSNDDRNYDIAIRPLDFAMTSTDGKVQIPLENVYINNHSEDVYMRYNEYSYLFRNRSMGGVPRNLTARVKDFGMVPSGVYNLLLEIQAVDSETQTVVSNTTFNLQMVVPIVQTMNFYNENPRINVGASNAFLKNTKITAETAPVLYINSNCDWVLTANTDDFGDTIGNYYIRTISGSANVTERLQERVFLAPGKDIVIARGKAPSNNESVMIEYSMENKDGQVFPAGNYQNKVRFKLSEDRGGK